MKTILIALAAILTGCVTPVETTAPVYVPSYVDDTTYVAPAYVAPPVVYLNRPRYRHYWNSGYHGPRRHFYRHHYRRW